MEILCLTKKKKVKKWKQKNENKNKKWNDFSIVRRENERNFFLLLLFDCAESEKLEKKCV